MAEPQQTNTEPQQQTTPPEPQQQDSGTVLGGAQTTPPEPAGAPGSYDFSGSIPDGATLDEKEATNFGNLCRELNLSNEQANKLASYGFGYAQRGFEAYNAQRETEINGWADEAKKDLGTEYDSTVHLAAIGVEALEKTCPGIRDALNTTGAGNRVEFIRAFAMLGKLVQEDPGKGNAGKPAANDSLAAFYSKSDFSKFNK